MNSTQPGALLGGKLNHSSAQTPTPQQQQQGPSSPSFESSTRRSSSAHSNTTHGTARNNQSSKKNHKKHKRPGGLLGDDSYAENTAMRNSTSRRGQTSITHLMNFALPPRPSAQVYPRSSGRDSGYTRSGLGSGYHASDKARYVHANYRFIVHPSGDYRAQAVDADAPLDWDSVLQILVSAESQLSSCPICLSHPVAPRMAKCGHIFCLPCLIRYMHSTDDEAPEKKTRWKKCPLCWDSIYMSDTRPVRWFTGQENPAPKEGEDVILRLVMRQPGSTLTLPRDEAESMGRLDDIPWYFAAEVTDYSRVMKGTEEYMTDQFDKEIEDLKRQEKEDELMFGDETTWAKKAVRSVIEAKEHIKGMGNAPAISKQPARHAKEHEIQQAQEPKTDDEKSARTWVQLHDGEAAPVSTPSAEGPTEAPSKPSNTTGQHRLNPVADAFNHLSLNESTVAHNNTVHEAPAHNAPAHSGPAHNLPAQPHAPYYFYQGLQHYYLAPLDIRILKAAFGNFSSFPSTLLPRVEHVSTGHIIDDELRKRTKYLAHLPYGCEVSFLECNWTDVVPDSVLANFAQDISRRREKNREKENREEKARVRAEKLEDEERWANVRKKRQEFSTPVAEERFGAADFLPLVNQANADGTAGNSPPYATHHRPGFESLANHSPGTSPPQKRTVWGTTVLAPTDGNEVVHEESGNDGWLQDWEKELHEENEAMIRQVEAASLADEVGEGSGGAPKAGNGGGGGGGGKKKKGKKITLMSTTARRAA
ncbi:hypothetical protein V501_03456 [Pseudogymnoascus sp. VKM F-4519 (FW-2642)]|nr:hypothetical protein V501_03456 [Pseudogymnoascus sp. VKM F-4519 (FW-2642)]